MGLFRAIWRGFRALGYVLVGNIDAATKTIRANPAAIQANFDEIIADKNKRILTMEQAMAGKVTIEEQKKAKLRQLTEDIIKHERLKAGAAARAKEILAKHGGDTEKAKADPVFSKCQTDFKDFSSTLAEKKQRADELEADIKRIGGEAAQMKAQIDVMIRERDRLKEEKHDTVADVVSATQEKQANDMVSGLANNQHDEELQMLRDMRNEAVAAARVSREVAGVGNHQAEAEYLAAAGSTESDKEFNDLLGISEKKVEAAPQPAASDKLPEN